MKAWLNGTLLVRAARPVIAWYGESGLKRGLSGLGNLTRESGLYRNMARVAAKGFYTETSRLYRVLGAVRRWTDKAVDAVHTKLLTPVLHSGIVQTCRGAFRVVATNGFAAAGVLLCGFGAGFGGVSLALAIAGPRRLAASAACIVMGLVLIALRKYLAKHAKNSAVVRLFLYLLRANAPAEPANKEGMTI